MLFEVIINKKTVPSARDGFSVMNNWNYKL
jgi:hypothetical protein